MKPSLADCSQGNYLLRVRVARMFAGGSNDLPGWRSIRRWALTHLLRAPGLRIGSHVRLDRSHPELGGRLVIGAGVDIGPRVILDISGGLTIEDEATLSMDALVLTHDHVVRDGSIHWRSQAKIARPLILRADSWVGARATVLGGVSEIGQGAIVGAASVVTKRVETLAVVVGVPAKRVHLREV